MLGTEHGGRARRIGRERGAGGLGDGCGRILVIAENLEKIKQNYTVP